MHSYRGVTLDPFQQEAIIHLQQAMSTLVCAPTGTGKTLIAEWLVDECLRQARRVVYTVPIKALEPGVHMLGLSATVANA